MGGGGGGGGVGGIYPPRVCYPNEPMWKRAKKRNISVVQSRDL